MKKIISLVLMLVLLNSCEKEVKNSYFTSDEIYNKIIEAIDITHKEISEKQFIGSQIKEVKISPLCASACDVFVLALKQNQQFKYVGESTHGGVGLPIVYKIHPRYTDHEVTLSLPSCRIFDGKMNLMEGVGVQ
jgi:hypothetical protein